MEIVSPYLQMSNIIHSMMLAASSLAGQPKEEKGLVTLLQILGSLVNSIQAVIANYAADNPTAKCNVPTLLKSM